MDWAVVGRKVFAGMSHCFKGFVGADQLYVLLKAEFEFKCILLQVKLDKCPQSLSQ